jgi:hypothetical protein
VIADAFIAVVKDNVEIMRRLRFSNNRLKCCLIVRAMNELRRCENYANLAECESHTLMAISKNQTINKHAAASKLPLVV